ncbi:MAG: YdcH family protein [Rhodospirillales bacterium]|nr:YdcH family protein [Rhodospirillales bacterium]
MNQDVRIESLKEKHHALEEAIEIEENRPLPDEVTLHELKKQKLQIKDQIAGISPQ